MGLQKELKLLSYNWTLEKGFRGQAFLLSLLVLLGTAQLSKAQETQQQITIPEAVELFAKHNLSLLLSKSESEEWTALARQATAYPNPSLLVSHEPLYRDGASSSETYFNLSQAIEWPGMRSARIDAAQRLAQSVAARFQADSLMLVFEVVKAYIEASAAEAQYQNVLQVASVFRDADRSADAQYTSGEMSGYHLRRLRIERARYENRLALAELAQHRLQRRLAMLILPEDNEVRIVPASQLQSPPAPLALEMALEQAQTGRAEMIGALAEVEAARFTLTKVKKEVTPAPTITAGYKRQSNGFGGLFLGTAFDLPVFDQKRGAIDANISRLYQAETRLILVQRQIEQDVRQAHETYVSLNRRTTLIAENLLGEVAQLLHAAQTSYAEGEMTLVELLDASDAYYDAQQTTNTLISSSLVAYYDLMRATGHIPLN